MKCIPAFTAIAAMSLAACDTMNTPISSGDFDPLSAPGSDRGKTLSAGATFSAGEFVRASIENTAFFKVKPSGDADADRLLPRGTSMKVISNSGSYVKVELDSGDIGFVPSVMLENPNAAPPAPIPGTNEYQIYPPLQGSGAGVPLPPIDPAGLPPEGAIPTVIDPDAPSTNAEVPPVTPTTDTFPTPPETKVPLPPTEEELKQGATPPPPAEKEDLKPE